MRLKAKTELTYAGVFRRAGSLFDALEQDARNLINQDQASPFNLEDPSTRPTLESMLAQMPAVPPVRLSPTSASPAAAGGAATFSVTIIGLGISGTWTVTKDAVATWLTIVSPTTPQSADGTVSYNVAANVDVQRAANMYVNGKTFTVTQAAGAKGG